MNLNSLSLKDVTFLDQAQRMSKIIEEVASDLFFWLYCVQKLDLTSSCKRLFIFLRVIVLMYSYTFLLLLFFLLLLRNCRVSECDFYILQLLPYPLNGNLEYSFTHLIDYVLFKNIVKYFCTMFVDFQKCSFYVVNSRFHLRNALLLPAIHHFNQSRTKYTGDNSLNDLISVLSTNKM